MIASLPAVVHNDRGLTSLRGARRDSSPVIARLAKPAEAISITGSEQAAQSLNKVQAAYVNLLIDGTEVAGMRG